MLTINIVVNLMSVWKEASLSKLCQQVFPRQVGTGLTALKVLLPWKSFLMKQRGEMARAFAGLHLKVSRI